MRYLVEPTPVAELKEGDIIYSSSVPITRTD